MDRPLGSQSQQQSYLDAVTRPCADGIANLLDLHAGASDAIDGGLKQIAKTAPLFIKGPAGYLGSIALYAFDSAHPSDTMKTQLVDAGLGATQGLVLKGGLEYLGAKEMSAAGKGAILGVGSTLSDLALNRSTYVDPTTGNASLSVGLSNLKNGLFSSATLLNAAESAAIYSGSEFALGRLNYKLEGRFARSPYLPTLATGGVFGATSGALGETMKEYQSGHGYSPGAIFEHAIVGGGIGTISAAPGAYLNARAALLPGRSLFGSAWQRTPPSPEEAISRAASTNDAKQSDLAKGQLSVGRQLTENAYLASIAKPDGHSAPAVFRTIDDAPQNVRRFQNENFAYHVGRLMGSEDSFPALAGRTASIDGRERLGYVQEMSGRSFEDTMKESAAFYPNMPAGKAIAHILTQNEPLLSSYQESWAQRMMMQEWDNHGHQFLIDNTTGVPKVKQVDLELARPEAKYAQDLVPTWGKTVSRVSLLNDQITAELAGMRLNPDVLSKIQTFVDTYSTPEGRQELSKFAASSLHSDPVLERARWFADNGTLPEKEPGNFFTNLTIKLLNRTRSGQSIRFENEVPDGRLAAQTGLR